MLIDLSKPVPAGKRSYTAGVTARRLFSVIGTAAALTWVLAAGDARGQSKPAGGKPPSTQDAARTASQAARAVADTAQGVADAGLPSDATRGSPVDHARHGVVVLERAGKPIGIGTVLKGDGRILTALSLLGNGNNVDARFADGSVSHVRVGHTDRAWDLALLIPQNGRWKEGLRASRTSPTGAGSDLRAFSLVGGNNLALARTIVKGETTLLGGDSELLRDALELASRFKDTDVGTPVLDGNGDVVALVANACSPAKNAPCSRVPYGVPVPAIKAFLRTVPATAVPPAPWLGIQGSAEDTGIVRGVRVIEVHDSSPAAAAGLIGGDDRDTSDMVVAVDGVPVTTPEQLAQEVNTRAVGDSVRLLVFGGAKFREVSLTLRAVPAANAALKARVQKAPARRPAPQRPAPPPARTAPKL
jgi:serine protease Do